MLGCLKAASAWSTFFLVKLPRPRAVSSMGGWGAIWKKKVVKLIVQQQSGRSEMQRRAMQSRQKHGKMEAFFFEMGA